MYTVALFKTSLSYLHMKASNRMILQLLVEHQG
jgi:hypothetical protein